MNHAMPKYNVITRLVPTWTLKDRDCLLASAGAEGITLTNDDKTRIFGIREIVKSDLFENPYCRPWETGSEYYQSLEELYNQYPYFKDKPIYDYDNKLLPWDAKENH